MSFHAIEAENDDAGEYHSGLGGGASMTIETPTTPRIVTDLSNADYHADVSAVSATMLKQLHERPSVFNATYIAQTAPPREATDAQDLGSLVHAMCLEPGREIAVTIPRELLASNGACSTKSAKDWRAQAEASGKIVLKTDGMETAKAMVASVRNTIGSWLDLPGQSEASIYWEDDETGVSCKARLDWIRTAASGPLIVDLKTTGDITPRGFARTVEQYAYFLQEAHYAAGVEELLGASPRFLFVAVENCWPFKTAVYEMSQSDRCAAAMVRRDLLNELLRRTESADWSDPWDGIVNPLSLHPKAIH